MAESDLHRQLKRAACHWLCQGDYAAVAEDVPVPGVGIIDVVAAGRWKRRSSRDEFVRRRRIDLDRAVFC